MLGIRVSLIQEINSFRHILSNRNNVLDVNINFLSQNLCYCVVDCKFQHEPSTFQCRRFCVQTMQYQDVLSPIRYGAVSLCRRRRRIWLFCTSHELISLTKFSVETSSLGCLPVKVTEFFLFYISLSYQFYNASQCLLQQVSFLQ